jgi:hypothetical protein
MSCRSLLEQLRNYRRGPISLAGLVLVGCLALGLPAFAQASSSPTEVQTEPAEAIPGGAKLKGELNPGGLPTTYYFEYIGDNAVECLGVENCWPQTAHMGPIAGDSQQQVPPVEVTGLRMGETYRYRLVASNADGTVQSKVATFTVGFSPVITSLEPNHGPTSGGTTVTIHGEPLENARSVHFGTVEGKILHEECDGECEIVPYRTLVVESPPHAAGTVDVTVETAQGVSVTSPGDEFTYGPSGGPSVESESFGAGQPAGSNSGDQPAASGGSLSSSTPGLQFSGPQIEKTTKLKPLTKAEKLAKALKACEKKPKGKRAVCEKQARNKYGVGTKTVGKQDKLTH